MSRAEFTVKTKLLAWKRAGGPDNPRCECGCNQPIDDSSPAEYHHVEEAESGDTPERRKYLRSLLNCWCVRRSCHKWITKTETVPKITKSRSQRAGKANAKRKASRPVLGSIASGWFKPLRGPARRREEG